MRVFLTEKPDQARVVSSALGTPERKDGYHQVGGDAVTWCFGHLLMPQMPEDYDAEMKAWAWDTLPLLPEPFRLKPRERAGKQLKAIRELLKRASEVVVATDADREGELIAYEVLTFLGWRGRISRLWLSDLTPAAVKRALGQIRAGHETEPLFHAAWARMRADWCVGLSLTRAVTLKLRAPGAGKPFSVGRVQTPTLALVVRLERQIRNFKPEAYYELVATIHTQSGHSVVMRFSPPPDKRIQDRARIERGREQAEGQSAPIQVQTAQKSQVPPELLDLNRLQQEANRRFGFSADHTLKIAQALYETHAVLTYPRTDSTALPEEHVERIPKILAHLGRIPELAAATGKIGEPEVRRRYYDDSKVTAHHAIVPTLKPCDPASLSADEAQVYLLVARHFLAAHMPDYHYTSTTMLTKPGGVPFRASGSVPVSEGWRLAFKGVPEDTAGDGDRQDGDAADGAQSDGDDAQGRILPPIRDGETGQARDVRAEEKWTKPPTRYTEATLLKGMRNIASEVEDPEARKRLKETSGIGTPATRAGIIETIKARRFVEVRKKQIHPTESGMALIAALEASLPAYCDPVTTAQWEDQLEAIAASSLSRDAFQARIAETLTRDIAYLKTAELTVIEAPGGAGKSARGAGARSGGSRKASSAPRSGTPKPGGGSRKRADGAAGGDWQARRREAIERGVRLKVPFDRRDQAKRLGAIWNPEGKVWMKHPDDDPAPFVSAGFLTEGAA